MNMLDDSGLSIDPKIGASSKPILISLGVLQIIFGIIALSIPWAASKAIAEVIAILFIITGFVQFFQTLYGHFGNKMKYVTGILVALLYVIAGCFLIINPDRAVVTLTFVIGWLFIIKGIFVFGGAFKSEKNRGWIIFNAVISLILGILILNDIQQGALWIIGLLVGINLIITGWTALFLGLSISKD